MTARRANLPRLFKISGAVLAVLFAIVAVLLSIHWPFSRQPVTDSLERVSSSKVQFGRFRKIYFPHPGYVAEEVLFTRASEGRTVPLVAIRRLTCEASWWAVLSFTHRIKEMRLEALQIFIPGHIPAPVRSRRKAKIETTVTELIADGALLQIEPQHPGGKPLRFEFARLAVSNIAADKSMSFRTVLQNPEPPGEITSSGAVGPLRTDNSGQTPVSGSFTFSHADLSPFHAIEGTLSAHGTFGGTLARIEVRGNTDIPNFEVTRSGHALHLSAEYHVIVDGLNGDMALQSADVRLLRTIIASLGRIKNEPGTQGKTVAVDFDSGEARIQDLLRLFVKANRPPLDGAMAFRAHVVLPPQHEPFLRRVRVTGDFGITGAEFTKPHTQQKIDELSKRTQSNKEKEKEDGDPERTVSDLKGHVILRNGTATFSKASFSVPGALVRMEGTYNLITERVDLHGTLAMQATLSHAAGGIKSILLKPLDPFFKKQGAGAVIAIRMTGTYSHPLIKVSLRGKGKSYDR